MYKMLIAYSDYLRSKVVRPVDQEACNEAATGADAWQVGLPPSG